MNFVSSLTLPSVLPYLLWRARGRATETRVRFRQGPLLALRPRTKQANDYGLAYEVFVHRFYDSPRPIEPEAVRCVVDLGGNVGFTPLFWAAAYPRAEVLAWEPHPVHLAQLRRNLALNPYGSRVTVRAAAAGVRAGRMCLSDEGTSSAEMPAGSVGLDVPVEDCLAELAGRRVDILKIDIEGGEYAVLRDPRFADLDVGWLVMEWHDLGDGQDGAWCRDRLRGIGYVVEPLFDERTHGMLWAHRPSH